MELPIKISPSVSGLILHVEEDTNDSYVEFEAFKEQDKTSGLVRFKFARFLSGRLYSRGGEAGYGIGVIEKSLWLNELNQQQKKWYPTFSSNFKDVKHYYFRGHDALVEVLATHIQLVREWKERPRLE